VNINTFSVVLGCTRANWSYRTYRTSGQPGTRGPSRVERRQGCQWNGRAERTKRWSGKYCTFKLSMRYHSFEIIVQSVSHFMSSIKRTQVKLQQVDR